MKDVMMDPFLQDFCQPGKDEGKIKTAFIAPKILVNMGTLLNAEPGSECQLQGKIFYDTEEAYATVKMPIEVFTAS